MVVVETAQPACLFRKLLSLGIIYPLVVGYGNMHIGGLFVPHGNAFQEELLDGAFLSQRDIHALVGVAKTTRWGCVKMTHPRD